MNIFLDCKLIFITRIISFRTELLEQQRNTKRTKKRLGKLLKDFEEDFFNTWNRLVFYDEAFTKPSFICSELKIETLKQGVKYVESKQQRY